MTDDMSALLAAFRAVSDRSRLRLLALCDGSELTVGELVDIVGQSQPRVSRHLRILVNAGLLERFHEGAFVLHRLASADPGAKMARNLLTMLPRDDDAIAADFERLAAVKAHRARIASAYFSRNAAGWDRLRSLYVDERDIETAVGDLLAGVSGGDLLDIGTGTGRMLEVLAPRFRRANGVDLSREMLAVARSNLERANLDNCTVRHADMYRLPFGESSFDAITIHQVLHYAEDPAAVVAEAARVLRPGGALLVVDFAPHDLENLRAEHAHRRLGFDDAEVGAWCAAAGIALEDVVHLPGGTLTVTLWKASRPAARTRSAA